MGDTTGLNSKHGKEIEQKILSRQKLSPLSATMMGSADLEAVAMSTLHEVETNLAGSKHAGGSATGAPTLGYTNNHLFHVSQSTATDRITGTEGDNENPS
jgi:hypothetical protein